MRREALVRRRGKDREFGKFMGMKLD